MERTLLEMLYDLQTFQCQSLDFCKLSGNGLGEPWFRIKYMMTAGGEQFSFVTILMRQEGSGIYFKSPKDMKAYAESRVSDFLSKPRHKFVEDRMGRFAYDWHPTNHIENAEI